MASLSISADGAKRIRFKSLDGQRKSIRLGRLPKKDAEIVRNYVGRLETVQQLGSAADIETLNWLDRISDWLHAKLAQVGLVTERKTATLGDFLNQYIDGRTDVKPRTKISFDQVRRNLLQFFGADKRLADITPGNADDFRLNLMERLSENTVRRRCGRAKQFFRAALRKRLIRENPFADMKGCGVRANASRFYFISREEAQRVLDACPDAEWKLIFALSRWGGLRCPSEHLGLRWSDINWEQSRFTVHSPKTEHHEGGESRVVPIFPELRPYLDEVWEQTKPGTEWVITRYRDSNVNLRTQLLRIIKRAGLSAWPKLFQNLRSTRATELVEIFPSHVAASFLGHCEVIADKFYRQVTNEHFQRAIASNQQSGDDPVKKSGHRTAHGPFVTGYNTSYPGTTNPIFSEGNEGLPFYTNEQVAEAGLEPARPVRGTGF